MSNPTLGFIGFGEAAYHICKGLKTEGHALIFAYDIMADDPFKGSQLRERAKECQVEIVSSIDELVGKCGIILCMTSAEFALTIAKEVSQSIHKDQVYVDLNAASPRIKMEIASTISEVGGWPVDGAVMEPVPPHGHKVPIYISGVGASRIRSLLESFGMNITYINETAGSSSAIKMIRSIFMKGFTSLLLETLTAAHKLGIEKEIVDSISGTLTNQPMDQLINMLLTRTVVHAERRVSEMAEVIDTLRADDLDNTMSQATKNKLQRLVDLKLNEYFDNKSPDHFIKVIEAISKQENVKELNQP